MAQKYHFDFIEVLPPGQVRKPRVSFTHTIHRRGGQPPATRLECDEPDAPMLYNLIRIALLLPGALLLESSVAAREAQTDVSTNAPAQNMNQPQRTFEVRHYDVQGNTLLSKEVIDGIFADATGPAVSLERIRKALGELQLAYRERGFVTVALNLPGQQLTNGTVKILVMEAPLVDVRVTGNHFFSSNNVMRALPGLRDAQIWKDEVINSHLLQRELDTANQNRDRQIYPTIEPGPLPGTSALVLKVKDRFPFHGRADVDNYYTPGTPDMRINVAAQYDNLWQYEHQIGLSYGFSPERSKADGLVPNYGFNEPQISYYGGYYRIPFGTVSVAEQVNQSTSFGYNEATHQFALPPASDRPDLTIFASASSSDTGAKFGPLQTVTSNSTLNITTQTSGRNLSENEDLGGRFTLPKSLNDSMRLNFFAGVDYKRYALTIYGTNTTTESIFFDPSTGTGPVAPIVDASVNPTVKNSLVYFPLNMGADFSENDKWGNTSLTLSGAYNFSGDATNFATLAYSPRAREHFGKFDLSFSRDQKLYGEWSALVRGSAQIATSPLISNEQFPLGGVNSVRGYLEGDDYGDDGWFGSIEIRTPYLKTQVASLTDFVPAWGRASVYADYGQRFLLDAPAGTSSSRSLLGTGFALSGNIDNHIDIRLAVAWPLFDSDNTRAIHPRAYVTIGGQF